MRLLVLCHPRSRTPTIEMASERQLKIYSHPISPYCRRVLYALAFKGIAANIIPTDLIHPSQEFLQASLSKTIPAATFLKDGREQHLCESLRIVEFLDREYPGPALYPRELNGSIDSLKKAKIDADIAHYIDGLTSRLPPIMMQTATEKDVNDVKALLATINREFVTDGRNFEHKLMDTWDDFTIVDVIFLPLVEVLDTFRKTVFAEILNQELKGMWSWYERMRTQPWATRFYYGPEPTRNYLKRRLQTGAKLTLPMTLYL